MLRFLGRKGVVYRAAVGPRGSVSLESREDEWGRTSERNEAGVLLNG